MSDTMKQAAAIAAQVNERVMDAVLEWGQALNEMVASEGEIKKTAELRARLCGSELQRLAMGLAKHFRPNRSSHVG